MGLMALREESCGVSDAFFFSYGITGEKKKKKKRLKTKKKKKTKTGGNGMEYVLLFARGLAGERSGSGARMETCDQVKSTLSLYLSLSLSLSTNILLHVN
ncbi:unnamed protein product [Linum tenue]|uniref:Uncharacterized protein n=1 Tax=Linum tenue TaxID=586396 RepID=A0AAV0LXE9_9ROSI|nr:unnamed protein product [Linum tenue]